MEIGKNDGRIHSQCLRSSNRDLRREPRVLADFNQRVLFADGPVFRHVAPGLSHEPYRGTVRRQRFAGLYEAGIGGWHEELM